MIDLSSFCAAIAARRLPGGWDRGRPAVAASWTRYQALLSADPPPVVYGANTLPGHRMADDRTPTAAGINRALFDSHRIAGEPPWLDATTIAMATACKIGSIAGGHVPVRPETYDLLVDYFDHGDWDAARVPANATYSCGDVVPAAHWLAALLDHGGWRVEQLGPGEVMALINGNFLSVGAAIAQLQALLGLAQRALANEAWLVDLTHMPRTSFDFAGRDDAADIAPALALLAAVAGDDDDPLPVQLPVSIRAIPQLLAMRHRTVRQLGRMAALAVRTPSGNPLLDRDSGTMVSQSSFLALDLSIALSGCIEMLLALMWATTERCKFLSAHYGEQWGDNPVATIQVVKQMQAQTEAARRLHGARTFVSGGSTSQGIEDFWGYTLMAARDVRDCILRLDRLLAVEARLLRLWQGRQGGSVSPDMAQWWAEQAPIHPRAAEFAALGASILHEL
jgi:histidine ammonia-lyase